jgi:hypothetical protein
MTPKANVKSADERNVSIRLTRLGNADNPGMQTLEKWQEQEDINSKVTNVSITHNSCVMDTFINYTYL